MKNINPQVLEIECISRRMPEKSENLRIKIREKVLKVSREKRQIIHIGMTSDF